MFAYDADGNLTGWTQAEPEWSDAERNKMLDLVEYERGICACGLHESVADADPDLELVDRICPTCKGLAVANRIRAAADEAEAKALGEKPPADTPRSSDGRHTSLALKSPDANSTTDADRPDRPRHARKVVDP